MKAVKINASRSYEVQIDKGLLSRAGACMSALLPAPRTVMVVSDDTVFALWGEKLTAALKESGYTVKEFVIPHGEQSKTPETLLALWTALAAEGLTRTDCLAALGGGLSWTIFLILSYLIPNEAICYFIVALMASLYAEAMARLLRSPATIFIAPSMIPLVPGASLYYTMSNALDGNLDGFVKKGLDTLTLAAALAIGVIVSAVIMRTVTKLTAAAQKRKKQC